MLIFTQVLVRCHLMICLCSTQLDSCVFYFDFSIKFFKNNHVQNCRLAVNVRLADVVVICGILVQVSPKMRFTLTVH